MPFNVTKTYEHVEEASLDLAGQTLIFKYRPALINKQMMRRVEELEGMDWDEVTEEVCSIATNLLVSWDVEDERGPVELGWSKETVEVPGANGNGDMALETVQRSNLAIAVDDNRLPLMVLFTIFGKVIRVTQEEPTKRGQGHRAVSRNGRGR